MIFNNPNFLYYLPLVLILMILKLRQARGGLKYSMASYVKEKGKTAALKSSFSIYMRFAAISLMVIALARPMLSYENMNVNKAAVDIMLVIDVSSSMRAVDFEGMSRLEAAKQAAKDFINNRKNDRIGIIAFSGMPVLHCPLTFDHNTVNRLIGTLEAGMIEGDTTSIGMGVGLALKYLGKSKAASKVIILLTDGADNNKKLSIETAANMASKLGIKLYSIGTGKPGPAKIPVMDPNLGATLVPIEDELDEKSLQLIAKLTGGKYYRATSQARFKEIYSEIDMMEKTVIDEEVKVLYKEKYYVFLYAAGILLLLEFILRLIYPGLIA